MHSSWRVALATAAFVGGVALALLGSVPWWVGALALMGGLAVLCVRAAYGCFVIAILWACVGNAYGSAYRGTTTAYTHYLGQQVTLRGKVKEDI